MLPASSAPGEVTTHSRQTLVSRPQRVIVLADSDRRGVAFRALPLRGGLVFMVVCWLSEVDKDKYSGLRAAASIVTPISCLLTYS